MIHSRLEKVDPKTMWRAIQLRNKGMSLNRIRRQMGLRDSGEVRNLIADALHYFDADDLSSLIANNRVNMPDQYRK